MRLRHLSSFCKCFKHARLTERALRSFPSAPHAHGLKWHSGTLGKSILCRRMVSSATSKPTDVDLVEASVEKILAGRSLLNLVDIGINLADSSYDKDRGHVIERAKKAGVSAMVVTGCDLKTSRIAQQLANEHEGLYFTAGVHPHNAKDCNEDTISALQELASDARCVAIGECGLDFNRDFSPRDVQEDWFSQQVALACKINKPLFLHCRDANQNFTRILQEHHLTAPAVAHCFTGNLEELKELLALDMYIGITGWVCDDRPERGGMELANLLPLIPRDRLMIETDGPYLTPRTIKPSKARPRRNEPALLPYVLQKVAQHLGETEEEVAERTTRTAKSFFGIVDIVQS